MTAQENSEATPRPAGGDAVSSRYICEERVGRGLFFEVFRGRDTETGETVAIKRAIFEPETEFPLDAGTILREEGQVLKQLNHPNVVELLDLVDEGQEVALILEYLDGGSLGGLSARDKPLPIRRVLEIALDLADALTRAHRLNLIHSDFKPNNVMIASDGTPRIGDLSFSYGHGADWLTKEGILFGTLPYMSPEDLAGGQPSILSNIWSFGIMLYEMLIGRQPFQGETAEQLKSAIANGPIPNPSLYRPDIPPALVNLIEQMLQKDPRQRLPSMRLISAELEAILHDEPSTLSPTPGASARPADALQATLLSGRFLQREMLAEGAHSRVYYGRDELTGQPVVIKRLKPELIDRDPELVSRFLREGQVLQQLSHPNIVQVLATLTDDGRYVIVMEYLPGGTLRDLLDFRPQLPLSQSLSMGLELADALSRAHHLGVIHRDLKPANVLIAEDGTPRLADFGLARLVRSEVRLTQTGTVMGSPIYMSPEACSGKVVDGRSDIWSLGVLLYETVAGRPPFTGEHVTAVLVNILHAPPPAISPLRAGVPLALETLLNQMLAKSPYRRPKSARQIAAELESIRASL